MCFSFKTSIISYILGMISGIFAICTRQIVLGCLILTYCQMQLSEALIWYGLDNNDTSTNKLGTSYGKYLLAMHNMAIGLGIILSILFVVRRNLKFTDFIPLILGIVFFICIVAYYYTSPKYPEITYPLNGCSDKNCQNNDNRLRWPYPYSWYASSFILSILILLFWVKPLKVKIFLSLFFSITWLVSIIYLKEGTVGSVWCFSAAILSPIIVLITYLLTRKEKNEDILT